MTSASSKQRLQPVDWIATKKKAEPSWLFSLQSKLTMDEGKIVLHDVEEPVIMFSDRPDRLVHKISAEQLIGIVSRMDATDPPNAVVSGFNANGESFETVVELTTASNSTGGAVVPGTVVFDFKAVGSGDGDAEQIIRLNACDDCDVNVFIDNYKSCSACDLSCPCSWWGDDCLGYMCYCNNVNVQPQGTCGNQLVCGGTSNEDNQKCVAAITTSDGFWG